MKWEWMAMQFGKADLQFRFRFAIVSARPLSSLSPIDRISSHAETPAFPESP
jgi:hypothetical protein